MELIGENDPKKKKRERERERQRERVRKSWRLLEIL